jgi:predicted DNA-binding transcriptional regulator YafY
MNDNVLSKVRILKIWEIIRDKTDVEHCIDIPTLKVELNALSIVADRRTISDGLYALIKCGYPIQVIKKRGCATKYYVSKREFTDSELRVLIDAVEAVKFIPAEQTIQLEKKIARLGGNVYSDSLVQETVYNVIKYTSNEVCKNIELINQAIYKGKYLIYSYINYDINGNTSQRFAGKSIPLGLVIKDGDYYFIRYLKRFGIKGLRVDLLANVKVSDDSFGSIEDIEELKEFDLGEFVSQSFDLFQSAIVQPVDVTFLTSILWITDVYERFGMDVKFTQINKNEVKFVVPVQISEAFYGWLASNSRKFKIISPNNVIDGYKSFLSRAMDEASGNNHRMQNDLEVLNFDTDDNL